MTRYTTTTVLDDVASITHGFAFDSSRFSDAGEHVLLTPGNFRLSGGFRKLGSQQKRYSGPVQQRFKLSPGDVLIAMTEQAPGLLGSALIVPEDGKSYLHNQRLGLLRVKDPTRVELEYLYHWFALPLVRKRIAEQSSGTKVKHTSPTRLASLRLELPSFPEQRKIADILRTWDDAIDRTMVLRDHLAIQFESIARSLLAPTAPASRHLSEMTAEISNRNAAGQLDRNRVMGVSNRKGLVPMRAQTIAGDISRYQVLPPKAFAYNPMRINVGSIAMSTFTDDVLVSPDYVLFECNTSQLLPSYLNHVLSTRRWRHYVNAGAAGSVRTRTYYNDLAAISIHTPPPDEQARIVRVLDTAKAEIDLLNRNLELLRSQKRGLMQKLLTGEVRVSFDAKQKDSADV